MNIDFNKNQVYIDKKLMHNLFVERDSNRSSPIFLIDDLRDISGENINKSSKDLIKEYRKNSITQYSQNGRFSDMTNVSTLYDIVAWTDKNLRKETYFLSNLFSLCYFNSVGKNEINVYKRLDGRTFSKNLKIKRHSLNIHYSNIFAISNKEFLLEKIKKDYIYDNIQSKSLYLYRRLDEYNFKDYQ